MPPRPPHCLRPAGRERVHSRIPDPGLVERRKRRVVDCLVVHEPGDRSLETERDEFLDLRRRATETGPFQQVRRLLVAEVRPGQRRQLADPGVAGRIGRRADGGYGQGNATGDRRRRAASRMNAVLQGRRR